MGAEKPIIDTDEVTSFESTGKALLAEFLGTMFIVLIGCGSTITVDGNTRTTLEIALAFAFVIASSVQIFGSVSGAHINPAVSVGLLACGRIGVFMTILYILFQCAGACAGAAFLEYLTPENVTTTLGTPALSTGVTVGQGFAIEATITGLLVLVVCAATDPRKTELGNAAPIAIGLAIACCHIFAIPFTSSAMNPARALGPAAITGGWDDHWIYWIGPLIGAAVAGILYRFIFSSTKEEGSSYDL